MTKKVLLTITTIVLAVSILLGTSISVHGHSDVIETQTIETTMMKDYYLAEAYIGTPRVEQMFVVDTEDVDGWYVVTMEDLHGHVWEVLDYDLYLYDDVFVLIVDNNTPDILDDDVVVRCWVGIG